MSVSCLVSSHPFTLSLSFLSLTGNSELIAPLYLNATPPSVSLFKPTIYAVGDPLPLLVCSSTSLSPHAVTAAATAPSEPSCSCGSSGPASASLTKRTPGAASAGYHNSCTVKHGSFGRFGSGGSGSGGGGEGLYYVTGSDDFRAYGWKVPEDVQELRERREQRVWNEWLESEPEGTGEEAVCECGVGCAGDGWSGDLLSRILVTEPDRLRPTSSRTRSRATA